VAYDPNGNITNLTRRGQTNVGATTFGVMDQLTYDYALNSNKLTIVSDVGNDTFGFKDDQIGIGVDTTVDYIYDLNGNMITDTNKGITAITYNHLNLPTQVTMAGGNISYIYDATGVKLRKIVSTGTTTDYAGNYVYENGSLQFFNTAEGYVEPVNASDYNLGFNYVYQYKDHLGNIRLSYSDKNKNGVILVSTDLLLTEIVEENNYYPFGLKHKGYNNAQGAMRNHKYGFNGKEEQDDNISGYQLNWLDFGARNYDAALGRWMNLDPVAEMAPSITPYRYAFNNPLSFVDPDGMYEWRVNSKTGEYERVGDEGGNKEQVIYIDDNKEATATLKGANIYVGAVSTGWHKDGEISYAVSNTDLWSDVPDEYQGAYTVSDLQERNNAKKEDGVKYESIQSQESQGLARKDQIWNGRDYGRQMDKKFGSRSAFLMAADTGILEEIFNNFVPGLDEAHKIINSYGKPARKFSPKFNKVSASASVGSSQLSNNSWIRFLQVNKGKYKGLGTQWVKQAASDYQALKKAGKL